MRFRESNMCSTRQIYRLIGGMGHTFNSQKRIVNDLILLTALQKVDVIYGWSFFFFFFMDGHFIYGWSLIYKLCRISDFNFL